MSYWMQMYLQDSISPSMLMLSSFHNFFVIIMTLLITLISYMMMFLMLNTITNYKLQEKNNIELVGTTISSLILMSIAIPSLHLLYVMDELNEPALTIKANKTSTILFHMYY